jgi:hypothetical protein
MIEDRDKLEVAISLLVRVLPILDLPISGNNDCGRLRREIMMFLAGHGLPGYLRSRGGY